MQPAEEHPRVHQRTTLANGLRIVSEAMPHTRSVSVSIYIAAGSRYETRADAGMSHVLEHMLFKGTKHWPTAQAISEAIDGVGGVLNGATDRELTVYYIKAAAPHFELAAGVLLDMVRRPLFEPAELEKERLVIVEELRSVADSPQQQAEVLLDETVFPDQPLGWDVAGFESTVLAIPRETLLAYLAHQYVPNNIVISVAGNVPHDEVVAFFEREAGDWQRGDPVGWSAAKPATGGPRLALLTKRTEQAHLTLSLPGVCSTHPDRYAIDLLSAILGEGMSSRLFMELRERRGLCYDVHTYASKYLDTGTFTVYAGVDPKKAPEALDAILKELARTRDGIPEDELHRAKELSKGRTLLRMEDTRNVSSWIGVQELLFGRVRTADEVVEDVEKVTTDDLLRVARQLLDSDQLAVAIVGPYRSDARFRKLLPKTGW
jgi:predicted Zn-dependent peptidase